jgi:hypothetical protein
MADAGRYVFRCAEDAHRQITHLFDFVGPTAIALWNLRWQVQGFLRQVPDATSSDLSNRFALRSGMRGGELKRACLTNSWEAQLERFASLILVNTIAVYEDYVARMAEIAANGDEKLERDIATAMQFPGGASVIPGTRGRDWAYSKFGPTSAGLANVFGSAKRRNKRYSPTNIDNLLICYRFFKAMRNKLAHSGGRADTEAVNAYQRFLPIASPSSLGLQEVPKHNPITLGGPIRLELRGVIGLCDVILRIIATYDVDLSDRQLAEQELLLRLKPIPGNRRLIKGVDPQIRERRISELIKEARLPDVNITPQLKALLKDKSIIPSFW